MPGKAGNTPFDKQGVQGRVTALFNGVRSRAAPTAAMPDAG